MSYATALAIFETLLNVLGFIKELRWLNYRDCGYWDIRDLYLCFGDKDWFIIMTCASIKTYNTSPENCHLLIISKYHVR